jgi:hypothetical protein
VVCGLLFSDRALTAMWGVLFVDGKLTLLFQHIM